MMVDFTFHPLQWVEINFAGMRCGGRVAECHVVAGNHIQYKVEYVVDGLFKEGTFQADELTAT